MRVRIMDPEKLRSPLRYNGFPADGAYLLVSFKCPLGPKSRLNTCDLRRNVQVGEAVP
jgi:hypothetical protein